MLRNPEIPTSLDVIDARNGLELVLDYSYYT